MHIAVRSCPGTRVQSLMCTLSARGSLVKGPGRRMFVGPLSAAGRHQKAHRRTWKLAAACYSGPRQGELFCSLTSQAGGQTYQPG